MIGKLMLLFTGKLLTTPSRLFKLLIPLSTGIQGEHKGVCCLNPLNVVDEILTTQTSNQLPFSSTPNNHFPT